MWPEPGETVGSTRPLIVRLGSKLASEASAGRAARANPAIAIFHACLIGRCFIVFLAKIVVSDQWSGISLCRPPWRNRKAALKDEAVGKPFVERLCKRAAKVKLD